MFLSPSGSVRAGYGRGAGPPFCPASDTTSPGRQRERAATRGPLDRQELRELVARLRDQVPASALEWVIVERTVMDDEYPLDVAADLGISRQELMTLRRGLMRRLGQKAKEEGQ